MTGDTAALPVVCLMGPTAAGKTNLAVELAASFPFDVVSVDSAMVYRRLDIGSGKPDRDVLSRVPHKLVDVREPHDPYSAADFRREALAEIRRSHAAGRVPLLVGGTGLYFKSLLHGLSSLPGADSATRERLETEARSVGWHAMHARLARQDPESAARIHPNDPQRIQRALEVLSLTGTTMSEQMRRNAGSPLAHPVVSITIEPSDRDRLHRDIEARFIEMLERGLVDEVRGLKADSRLHADLPAVRAVGYRQVWHYLEGRTKLDEMTAHAIAATRQLARRQLTWLRSEAGSVRFDCHRADLIAAVSRHLERLPQRVSG